MSIEKINALKTAGQTGQLDAIKTETTGQTDIASSKPNDKEKSNATKYMIGATALAGMIAVGIIGHKQGWWGKAEKAAAQLTSNETPRTVPANTPKPASEDIAAPVNSGYDIIRVKLENGYALLCKKTGKAFNKIYDDQNKSFRYIYSRTLENGSNIGIAKYNILSTSSNGEQIHIPLTEYSLRNKDGKLIYKTSIEKGSNFRPETIYDYETMTAYEVRTVKASILGCTPIPMKEAVKMPFEEVDGKIKLKNETPLELSELEQVRQKIFDNNLPASYNRLKSKFLKNFEYILDNKDKNFIRYNDGNRVFTKTLDKNGNKITHIKRPDGTTKFLIGKPGDPDMPYTFRIDKVNGKLVEFEGITLPDGRSFRKVYDDKENSYVFEQINGDKIITITEKEFTKYKNYAIANVLPDGITSRFSNKTSSLPKNADGSYIIKLKNSEYEIRYPGTNNIQYNITIDDDGKIGELIKFNQEGKRIAYAARYKNGCTFKDSNGYIKGSYEECGLDKLEELIKDTTGILN